MAAPRDTFDRAVRKRDVAGAVGAARSARPLDLGRALRLTVLLGEERAPSFRAAAMRWLLRWLREAGPTLHQVRAAAEALDALRDPVGGGAAADWLRGLAGRVE